MYEKKIPLDLECTLVLTQEVMRGKWKPCLLAYIEAGVRRPSELHKQLPHAPARVLNMQLRQLEAHELLTKTVFDDGRAKVEYHLTPFGRSLLPVILTLAAWGDANRSGCLARATYAAMPAGPGGPTTATCPKTTAGAFTGCQLPAMSTLPGPPRPGK